MALVEQRIGFVLGRGWAVLRVSVGLGLGCPIRLVGVSEGLVSGLSGSGLGLVNAEGASPSIGVVDKVTPRLVELNDFKNL